jgi:type IV pilus assembly protein PilA
MKKLTKKNNKGFTLVELIVVVLIMAILAAALAPQVMKWVNNSKVSADVSTYETLVSSVQLALADEKVYDDCTGTTATPVVVTVTLANGGVSFNTGAPTSLNTELVSILGSGYATTTKTKVSSASYTITITNGVVLKDTTLDTTLD